MGYVEDLRKIVGHRPLILTGAVVAILNEKEELLLEQRTYPSGVWGLPGGLMELGESMEDTAKREVLEETNLVVENLKLIDIYSGNEFYTVAENGDEFYSVTGAYYTTSFQGEIVSSKKESLQCKFFPKHQLPDQMVGSHRKMIEDLLNI
ncbi:NUDIX hydrolase [Halobacillus sp. A5]|uniref:NUDIX hydrolase n=1 Tax=Halobacillus sp. A5 TaxID=2880263 RepID=UPI0020A6A766|nr:NUDIX hydrolase [Halobacillus sp. A5]MCP3029135.1 NUDIX hydrolase [Halobacillus sp. A5]